MQPHKMMLMLHWIAALVTALFALHVAAEEDLFSDKIIDNINFTTCYTSPQKLGWEVFTNYTAGKRLIFMEQGSWDSARVSSRIVHILLSEVMGYRIQYSEFIGSDHMQVLRLQNNAMDIIVEMWASVMPLWYDYGSMGYSGRDGVYIPTWMVEEHPSIAFDFWRFFLNPEAQLAFRQRGWKPSPVLSNGEFACDAIDNGCQGGTYRPAWYSPERDIDFINLWGIRPEWNRYYHERLIDGMKLNATITYFGDDLESMVDQALKNRSAIIFHNWKPSSFISSRNVTRITFPEDTGGIYDKFDANRSSIPVTVDEPFKPLTKGGSFRFSSEFPELGQLLQRVRIREDQIAQMLRELSQGDDYSVVACNWIKNNYEIWSKWIPPPPQSIDNCPIGTGRYIANGLAVCLKCPANTYSWSLNNTGECLPCVDNAICPGGSIVNAKSGYWMPNINRNSSSAVLLHPELYVCPYPNTCCPGDNCTQSAICADGFRGKLCTECSQPGHYLWNHVCMNCDTLGSSLPLIIVGSFLASFGFLFVPKDDVPAVELLFFYFQVVSMIFGHNLQLYFNSPRLGTFLALTNLDIDGLVVNCPGRLSGLPKQVFRFLLPCLLPFSLTIVCGIGFLARRVPRISAAMEYLTPWYMKGQALEVISFRCFKAMLTLILMPLVEASLNIVDCQNIMRQNVVYRVPELVCFAGEHTVPAAVAVVIIILLLVILPISLAIALSYLWKNGLIDYDWDETKHDLIVEMRRTLYEAYRPKYFYMEPLMILEKGLIVAIFSLLAYNDNYYYLIYIALFATLCLIRLYIQPYRDLLEGYLEREMTLGWIVLLALRLASLRQTNTNNTIPYVIFMLFLPVGLHVARWLRAAYFKHKDTVKDIAKQNTLKMTGEMNKSLISLGSLRQKKTATAEMTPLDPDSHSV